MITYPKGVLFTIIRLSKFQANIANIYIASIQMSRHTTKCKNTDKA